VKTINSIPAETRIECYKVECLWVKLKGKANKADILLGVFYRPLKMKR